jgi:FKBP-type peptidyl-prolyl cis-trans isomerase FklB
MTRTLVAITLVAAAALPLAGYAEEKQALETAKDKTSYALGVDIANNVKRQGFEVDAALVAQGFKDALTGAAMLMDEKQVQETIMAFQKERQAKRAEEMKVKGEKNKVEGDAFLAENKKKEGVVTLPSGLQYKVVTEGTGAKPGAADTVSVSYRGTLIDGTEFDSSIARGQPQTFKVDGVIPGWTEALQLMKEGDKWQIFIPANLAYGEKGAPPRIPPNSTLIFEVELISVPQSG